MKVLYYAEPKLGSSGGVGKVAIYLTKALSKKLSVVSFPSFTPSKKYANKLFNIYTRFARKDFDIVHFNYVPVLKNGSYILLELSRKMDYPVVLNIHGILPIECELDMMERPSSWSLASALRSCKITDAIVVNSRNMKTKLETFYGVDAEKIAVIPNGIDLTMFTMHNDKLPLQGDPSILFLGDLRRIKGVDILLQALTRLTSELPNMKLHLVGIFQDNLYQDMANKLGIQKYVAFHGGVPHRMVPSYFRSADICVFPSRDEGFPLVALEAMASGVPTIASDIAAFREIITSGKNGILFKAESSDSLSKVILALSQDSGLKRAISQTASKTVMKYSWENIADMYISLYKSLRQ